jgi:hypothetical protein
LPHVRPSFSYPTLSSSASLAVIQQSQSEFRILGDGNPE